MQHNNSEKKGSSLSTMPCQYLKGVGPQLAQKLAKRSIHTVQDLLFHLPLRYQDRRRITPLRGLRQGEWAVVQGRIVDIVLKRRPRSTFECVIEDESGTMKMRLFHFSGVQIDHLAIGKILRCFGETRWRQGSYEMVHPEYVCSDEGKLPPLEKELTPIYPTTEGLSQKKLRALTDLALDLLAHDNLLVDYLPAPICHAHQFPDLKTALQRVHRPPNTTSADLLEQGKDPAQHRLAFEELIAHHLSLRRIRECIQKHEAPAFSNSQLSEMLLKNLPYELTSAQKKVSTEIQADLNKPIPMMRLVQGDVGSGKTIVCALAALQAVECGYQVAVMVPTELLAEQHEKNFRAWFEPLNIRVEGLKSNLSDKLKQERLKSIQDHSIQVAIGTHALFQKHVQFSKLGLIIVDEQHRFGVQQRLDLWEKGSQDHKRPHQLILSATPIPRTLAMTAYADLDCSVIDELPPGRKPIVTVALADTKRHEVVERVRFASKKNQQIYWVCTLIEESEVLQCQTAEETAQQLRLILPELNIGLIHGRLKSAEKEEVMRAFVQGEFQLLVATTVIEVGVDVPNANLMVIENPERLGLAQLHQLRGRIGRGSEESFCVLLYKNPLSKDAFARLDVMRKSQDGFVIAQKDLEIRGPGEVLGTRQTGLLGLRIANLVRDQHLIAPARQAAETLMREHSAAVEPLISRWLGAAEQFGQV